MSVTPALPHPVGAAKLRAIVAAAKRGETCLDKAVSLALWDGKPPALWRDWPPEAVAVWDEAVRLYRAKGGLAPEGRVASEGKNGRPHVLGTPTAASIWAVVLEHVAGPNGAEWPRLPGLRVCEMAKTLGCSARALSYHMGELGWKWAGGRGNGGRITRRVVSAPCLGCSVSHPAFELDPATGLCKACSRTSRRTGPRPRPGPRVTPARMAAGGR